MEVLGSGTHLKFQILNGRSDVKSDFIFEFPVVDFSSAQAFVKMRLGLSGSSGGSGTHPEVPNPKRMVGCKLSFSVCRLYFYEKIYLMNFFKYLYFLSVGCRYILIFS